MKTTKQSQTVVIIGGVAGGASCAARLRRLDEFAHIIIYEQGPHVSFANCGLPYQLGGEIASPEDLLVQTPEKLSQQLELDVRVLHRVEEIDRGHKRIRVRDLHSGQVHWQDYDHLVLATGATPIVPNLPGIERPGIFMLRTIPDLESIKQWMEETTVRKAVVIGAGFIGLEVVEQLHHLGLEITLIDNQNQVLPPLDEEMANLLLPTFAEKGVQLRLGASVVAFEEPESNELAAASMVVLGSGERLPADLILMGVGVRPQLELARKASLQLGTRGIRVDAFLRTNDPSIYAVGDVIEVYQPVLREWGMVPLAGPANRQGRIAADNISGRERRFEGSLGTAIVRLFGRVAAATGASEKALRRSGIPYHVVHTHPNHHAGYYPGAEQMALKLLFAYDGKVLGAQAVGGEGVDKRIDVIATALKGEMSVDDLAELELCYAPMFGSAKDPVNLIAMAAQNLIQGLVKNVRVEQLNEPIPAGVTVLDVRSTSEHRNQPLPLQGTASSLHIPLPELRGRIAELSRDRQYWVHCASGQRSYNACRILIQHGIDCRNVSGSYRTWLGTHSAPRSLSIR